MHRLVVPLIVAGAVCAACGDAGGVDPDAIDEQEFFAVRRSIDSAFANDTLYYPTLSFVLFFVDRASFIGPDSTRLVGVELDIRATQNGDSVRADFTTMLGWRGYDAGTRTVDSVFLILGAGRAPVDDSLRTGFSPDTAGTGTGFVIRQNADSSVAVWLARGGHLRTTTSSYGGGRTQSGGGLELTTFRGTISGDYTITAKSVPDSTTTVTSGMDFGSGVRALKVRIRGNLPVLSPPPRLQGPVPAPRR